MLSCHTGLLWGLWNCTWRHRWQYIRFLGSNFCFAVKWKSKGIARFVCSPAFAVKAWCTLKSCFRWLSGILGIFAIPLTHLTEKFFFPGDPDPVLRCIVSGFFANAAKYHSTGAYRWLYTVSLQVVLGWKAPVMNKSKFNQQADVSPNLQLGACGSWYTKYLKFCICKLPQCLSLLFGKYNYNY